MSPPHRPHTGQQRRPKHPEPAGKPMDHRHLRASPSRTRKQQAQRRRGWVIRVVAKPIGRNISGHLDLLAEHEQGGHPGVANRRSVCRDGHRLALRPIEQCRSADKRNTQRHGDQQFDQAVSAAVRVGRAICQSSPDHDETHRTNGTAAQARPAVTGSAMQPSRVKNDVLLGGFCAAQRTTTSATPGSRSTIEISAPGNTAAA
jgi:hypothetical protein